MSVVSDLWRFLRGRHKLWLLPLIVVLLALAALLVLGESSALAPFIYTVF